jgi:hypothetical protein
MSARGMFAGSILVMLICSINLGVVAKHGFIYLQVFLIISILFSGMVFFFRKNRSGPVEKSAIMSLSIGLIFVLIVSFIPRSL